MKYLLLLLLLPMMCIGKDSSKEYSFCPAHRAIGIYFIHDGEGCDLMKPQEDTIDLPDTVRYIVPNFLYYISKIDTTGFEKVCLYAEGDRWWKRIFPKIDGCVRNLPPYQTSNGYVFVSPHIYIWQPILDTTWLPKKQVWLTPDQHKRLMELLKKPRGDMIIKGTDTLWFEDVRLVDTLEAEDD